jgi:N-acetylneuraminate synthase
MVKIASCNTGNQALIDGIRWGFPDIPFVFSIGGTSLEKVNEIVQTVPGEIYIQQCTSTYPCPPEQLNLGNISALQEKYPDPRIHIGYSGHEKGWYPTLLAVMMGAEIVERHFCLSRDSFVHHIECSLEPKEFKEMTEAIRNLPVIQSKSFGMKDSEKKFLVENTYGTDDLEEGWTYSIS